MWRGRRWGAILRSEVRHVGIARGHILLFERLTTTLAEPRLGPIARAAQHAKPPAALNPGLRWHFALSSNGRPRHRATRRQRPPRLGELIRKLACRLLASGRVKLHGGQH